MAQTLGKRIVENRKRLKLTQDQLAEKLGVTAQAVSKWENDQSCPDITMLPKLAGIFGISTDALLGYETHSHITHEAEIVTEEESENDGIHIQKGNWEIRWDSKKSYSVGFAVLVLCVGLLLFFSQIFTWNLSFWDILWTTSLFIFGVWEIWRKLSFFKIGCILFGGYALISKILQISVSLDKNLVWAVLILLFGASLLADAIKKPKKPVFFVNKSSSENINKNNGYQCSDNSFMFENRFGEIRQNITLDTLQHGDIRVSFGEYTINMSGIKSISPDCTVFVQCNFGELHLIVPSSYKVVSNPRSAFANVEITGTPDENPSGILHLDGSINFGELEIEYV